MDLEDIKLLGQNGESYWWFVSRREFINKMLLKLLKGNNKKLNILDIGCGTGEYTEVLKKYGTVFSLEYSKETIALLAKNNSNRIVYGNAEWLCFKRKSFDIVLMLDLLEHLEKDENAIIEAGRVLKNGSHLLISVPAIPFLFGTHDRLLGHKRRYSKKGLSKLLAKSEFKSINFYFWNFFLFWPILVIRSIKKLTGNQNPDLKGMKEWVNRRLLNISRIENLLISLGVKMPVGTSLLIVIKK